MTQPHHQWFTEARFGMFIHFGPYSAIGRGEQALFRECIDQTEYADFACKWNPQQLDPADWVAVAKQMGCKYVVLTTRHHDGYCLWDSKLTDYTSTQQASKRDIVAEYVQACRDTGLRVGLYYSLADWRIPAYWDGVAKDPEGFARFRDYVHGQVRELLTNYGKIDVLWFDGAWPHSANDWQSIEWLQEIRQLQPEILTNRRLGLLDGETEQGLGVGESDELGDIGTPEHHITADGRGRLWESCQVSTWRLWGYTIGEHWRTPEQMLDMLVQCASKGGNLLLNVGPDGEGRIPDEFRAAATRIGTWLENHGEAIYGKNPIGIDGQPQKPGDITEFITRGYQTVRDGYLYLILRFWDRRSTLTLRGLLTPVTAVEMMPTGHPLPYIQVDDKLVIDGLPTDPPVDLFPVIKLALGGNIELAEWAQKRLWGGDPARMTAWARARGTSVWRDGVER